MYEITRIDEQATQKEREHLVWKSFAATMSKEESLKWAEGVLFKNHAIFAAKTTDQIAAMICLKHPIENHIRGANLSFGGIGEVSTLPEYRRERLIRKLFKPVFEYMYETGIVYSALGPFSYPFYEKFGYALAEQVVSYEFPSSQLKALRGDASITMREYQERDAAGVMQVQRSMGRFGSRFYMPSEYFGRDHAYVLEQGGEIAGFVRFSFKDEGRMQVQHTFFSRDEIFPAVVDLVYRFASQTKTVTWQVDPEIYLEAVLNELGQVKRVIHDHMMVRVVKFKEFCQQIKVPLYAAEPVIIQLVDEDCPWNTGTFKLTPVSGRLEISETDRQPEIGLNALQLSYAVGGMMPASRLRRVGGLDCSHEAAEKFTNIFPQESLVSYVAF